jgi:DNA-binding LacI/PurR family transcriptional regulator
MRDNALGVVLAPRSTEARAYYQELIGENIAVVLADMCIPDCREDHVLIDNAYGIQLSTRHLIQLGHQRLAYISDDFALDDFPPIVSERRRGFVEACRQAGNCAMELININPREYQVKLRDLLTKPNHPTGIVAYNDTWAVRIIHEATALGMKVPRDLSVVGFDDSTLVPKCEVPLTTINPERDEMGTAAVELLIAKIERTKSQPVHGILITPRLVVRESTAPPPSAVTT